MKGAANKKENKDVLARAKGRLHQMEKRREESELPSKGRLPFEIKAYLEVVEF